MITRGPLAATRFAEESDRMMADKIWNDRKQLTVDRFMRMSSAVDQPCEAAVPLVTCIPV
jgi:hypothetical protein